MKMYLSFEKVNKHRFSRFTLHCTPGCRAVCVDGVCGVCRLCVCVTRSWVHTDAQTDSDSFILLSPFHSADMFLLKWLPTRLHTPTAVFLRFTAHFILQHVLYAGMFMYVLSKMQWHKHPAQGLCLLLLCSLLFPSHCLLWKAACRKDSSSDWHWGASLKQLVHFPLPVSFSFSHSNLLKQFSFEMYCVFSTVLLNECVDRTHFVQLMTCYLFVKGTVQHFGKYHTLFIFILFADCTENSCSV